MNDPVRVRTAAIGLVSFAAAEEQMLLAAEGADGAERGSPAAWAARPLVAHNAECRDQQVQRLAAIREARIPPGFAEVDHSSPEVYRRYCEQPADAVAEASRRTAQALVAGLSALADEDLLVPRAIPGCTAASSGCRSSSGASGIRRGTSATITSPAAGPAGPWPCRRRR